MPTDVVTRPTVFVNEVTGPVIPVGPDLPAGAIKTQYETTPFRGEILWLTPTASPTADPQDRLASHPTGPTADMMRKLLRVSKDDLREAEASADLAEGRSKTFASGEDFLAELDADE